MKLLLAKAMCDFGEKRLVLLCCPSVSAQLPWDLGSCIQHFCASIKDAHTHMYFLTHNTHIKSNTHPEGENLPKDIHNTQLGSNQQLMQQETTINRNMYKHTTHTYATCSLAQTRSSCSSKLLWSRHALACSGR